jgi:hypothetical protein
MLLSSTGMLCLCMPLPESPLFNGFNPHLLTQLNPHMVNSCSPVPFSNYTPAGRFTLSHACFFELFPFGSVFTSAYHGIPTQWVDSHPTILCVCALCVEPNTRPWQPLQLPPKMPTLTLQIGQGDKGLALPAQAKVPPTLPPILTLIRGLHSHPPIPFNPSPPISHKHSVQSAFTNPTKIWPSARKKPLAMGNQPSVPVTNSVISWTTKESCSVSTFSS